MTMRVVAFITVSLWGLASAIAQDLYVGNGGTIYLGSGAVLKNTTGVSIASGGTVQNNAGMFYINGSLSNSGTLQLDADAALNLTGISLTLSHEVTEAFKNLYLSSDSKLIFGTTNSLTLSGALSGTGVITGKANAELYFTGSGTSQTLYLDQTSPRTSNLLKNFGVSNTAACTLGNALIISTDGGGGTVTVGSGSTLNTGGYLTLASDASGTGRIGNMSGTLSGNYTIERFIATGARRFRFLSSPVVGATALQWRDGGGAITAGKGIQITGTGGATNGFDESSTNASSAFWHNESLSGSIGQGGGNDPGWTAFSNGSSEALTNGKGFRVLVRGDRNTSLTVASAPTSDTKLAVTGSYPTSLTFSVTKTGTASNSGFNLLGNPFPCDIDFNAFHSSNSGIIDAAYYLYNPRTNSYGTWNGSTGTQNTTQYISSSQAFFVLASSTGSVSFTEAHKSSNYGAALFKKDPPNLLRMNLRYDSLNSDELINHFKEGAGAGFDRPYDAFHLRNSGINFSSLDSSGISYAIQTLPPLTNESVVGIDMSNTTKANYVLTLMGWSGFDGARIFLHDALLNTTHEIDRENYSLSVVHDAASEQMASSRFRLSFVPLSSGLSYQGKSNVSIYPNPMGEMLQVFVPGQLLFNFEIWSSEGVKHLQGESSGSIDVSHLASGIYFIRVVHSRGVFVQRILK